MRAERKILILMAVSILAAGLVCGGCSKKKAEAGSVDLCTKCGQIKDGPLCCKPDQPKCIMCGLVEGSPGCCNIPEGAERAALCTACGHLKDSELCCKPGLPRCQKCGLVKDSPGCCKIPKS